MQECSEGRHRRCFIALWIRSMKHKRYFTFVLQTSSSLIDADLCDKIHFGKHDTYRLPRRWITICQLREIIDRRFCAPGISESTNYMYGILKRILRSFFVFVVRIGASHALESLVWLCRRWLFGWVGIIDLTPGCTAACKKRLTLST